MRNERPSNLKEFSALMIKCAKVRPGTRTPDFTDMDVSFFWYESLKDIPYVVLEQAMFKLCAKDLFPSIHDIKEVCGMSEFNDEQIAREFVPALVQAIERFGYMQESEARNHLGEIRWHVVSLLGGWNEVCRLTYEEIKAYTAHWREVASVELKKAKMGISGKLIDLEENPTIHGGQKKIQDKPIHKGLMNADDVSNKFMHRV